MIIKFIVFELAFLSFAACAHNEDAHVEPAETNSNPMFNPKTYSAIFMERRREHRQLTQQMLKYNYEKKHKLLKIGYSKIFELLNEINKTLTAHNYRPDVDGFALTDLSQLEALTTVLENCCLAGEFLMFFPELSRSIFKKASILNWSSALNWCIHFVNSFPHIIDDSSAKLMELLSQEINEELRSDDYVNPYYANSVEEATESSPKPKKVKKKLKKGPQLSGGGSHNEL